MTWLARLLLASSALLWSYSSVAYERVISLAPNITELIYAIGAENTLVATVNSSNYPPAALDLPRVGDGVTVAAESLLAFNPDAVFAWQPTRALVALEETLEQSGIALHYINPQSLAEIATSAQQLGDWLNQPVKAEQLKHQWQQQLQTLAKKYQTETSQTLFIALDTASLYTLNDPIINDALQLCGAQNWAKDSPVVAPAVNMEQLLATELDGIIYSSEDKALKRLLHLLKGTHSQPIASYQVNPDHFYRASPRLFDAVAQLCQQIAQHRKTSFTD